MPSIKYFIKRNSKTSSTYLRFVHGRKIDFKKTTKLIIDPRYWNNNKGQVRNISDFPNKLNVQNALDRLRSSILGRFNADYSEGVNINSPWLTNVIDSFFEQGNEDPLNYFVDYGRRFIVRHRPVRLGGPGHRTAETTICRPPAVWVDAAAKGKLETR